jgi:glycosyltransferase involved in cell wall biosynthesis
LKTDPPLVSVIIPVYNAELYLAETMTSALDQCWPNTELILIIDGASDNSLAIAHQYVAKNVKVVRQDKKGAAAARNLGLSLSSGKYIQFLDADDLLSADKIRLQVQSLEAAPGKIAVCSTVHFPDGQPPLAFRPSAYEEQFLYDSGDPVDFLIRLMGGYGFQASMVQPGAWLTPKSLIGKVGAWNETLSVDDDGEFFARVILSSAGITKTGGLNYYRKHLKAPGNLSARQGENGLRSQFNAILLKQQHLFKKNENEPARKAIYKQLVELRIKSYISYPSLSREIDHQLASFPDWGYVPPMGGKLINATARLFGWKTAARLQAFRKKF